MHLIIQYYNDKNQERVQEYNECLRKNLNNPYIKKIHNIIESDTKIPEEFVSNDKLLNIMFDYSKSGTIKGRLTFNYAFNYARQNIDKNEVICIVNLDIFLELSNIWSNLYEDFFTKYKDYVLCLCRYEYFWNNEIKVEDSQWNGASTDAWIFLNPIKEIKDCNFAVGNAPGCDAAIVKRFYNSGYNICNWPQKYKIFHLDICRNHRNGVMIITDKTDNEGKKALQRGRLDCRPNQDWFKILNNKIKPVYRII